MHVYNTYLLTSVKVRLAAFAFGFAGSFSGSFGDCEDTRRKRKMLEGEGVRFVDHKVRASPHGHL